MMFNPELHAPLGPASGSNASSRSAALLRQDASSQSQSIRRAVGRRFIADRRPARGGALTRVGSVPLRGRADSPAWRSLR